MKINLHDPLESKATIDGISSSVLLEFTSSSTFDWQVQEQEDETNIKGTMQPLDWKRERKLITFYFAVETVTQSLQAKAWTKLSIGREELFFFYFLLNNLVKLIIFLPIQITKSSEHTCSSGSRWNECSELSLLTLPCIMLQEEREDKNRRDEEKSEPLLMWDGERESKFCKRRMIIKLQITTRWSLLRRRNNLFTRSCYLSEITHFDCDGAIICERVISSSSTLVHIKYWISLIEESKDVDSLGHVGKLFMK